MNRLNVRQRKTIYAVAAVILFAAIIPLGAPAGAESQGRAQRGQSLLAYSRNYYDLGEASLGNVDPTSAAMNLVLLGFRGVVACWFWSQTDDYKNKKRFAELENTIETIILLQPHFQAVWRYQGWNLGYNVSAECDAVEDRFFWVKRGAKFIKRGINRNRFVPELKFDMGRFVGEKLGNADERDAYREFFLVDPDPRWKGGADEEINPPPARDNFLVSRDWYQDAKETLNEPGVEQHLMDLALFIAYPQRALMEYGKAFQKDGVKEDVSGMSDEERETAYRNWMQSSQANWLRAHDEWVNIYGREEIETSGGGKVVLENDERGMADLAQFAERENRTLLEKVDWQERYRKLTGYPYWKRHSELEGRESMAQARFHLAEGRRLYREVQDLEGARVHLEAGMGRLDELVKQYQVDEHTNLIINDEIEIVEDAIKSLLIWRQVVQLLGEEIPSEYPLQQIWDDPSLTAIRGELTERFLRWSGTN